MTLCVIILPYVIIFLCLCHNCDFTSHNFGFSISSHELVQHSSSTKNELPFLYYFPRKDKRRAIRSRALSQRLFDLCRERREDVRIADVDGAVLNSLLTDECRAEEERRSRGLCLYMATVAVRMHLYCRVIILLNVFALSSPRKDGLQ